MTTTTLVSSSKRYNDRHPVNMPPPPLETFKGMNNSLGDKHSLTYQQKKKLKLAKYRSKFENPLGYESNSLNTNKVRSNLSTTRTMYSTRSVSSQRSKSSVPSCSSNSSSLLSRWAFEPNERSQSVRSVKKDWDNRFPYSKENEHVRSPCHEKNNPPLGFTTNFFKGREEAYLRTVDLLDELEMGDFPVFNFKPLAPPLKNQEVTPNLPIDWYSYDIESLEDEYRELNDYKSARNYLYNLWSKLSIPKIYQQEFEKEHCQKDTVTNRTFIFSEIATMEALRDKIRIALIWLDGKTDYDIEENSVVWCQIVDSFKQEYEYMYKSNKFIYNGKDMFAIESPKEQSTNDLLV